ncbi:hypothetical protein D3C80_463340 [compost metagenome]
MQMIGLHIGDIHGSQFETIDLEQLHSKRLSFPPVRNLKVPAAQPTRSEDNRPCPQEFSESTGRTQQSTEIIGISADKRRRPL